MELQQSEDLAAAAEACTVEAIGEMQARVDTRTGERDEMTSRVQRAKESYETEALRKQDELHDVEEVLARLGKQNHELTSCVGQVREQISGREAAMRTQLGLLKNATAFALYVDDALLGDLTDPSTQQLFEKPVVVRPSGVSYSRATVEHIIAHARALDRPPLCPQSGLVIEGFAPNTALETILSRHTFKSQGTRDVLEALKQFTKEGGVSEGEQPLEEYVQAMKASMVDRMQEMHARQMGNVSEGFEVTLGAQKVCTRARARARARAHARARARAHARANAHEKRLAAHRRR